MLSIAVAKFNFLQRDRCAVNSEKRIAMKVIVKALSNLGKSKVAINNTWTVAFVKVAIVQASSDHFLFTFKTAKTRDLLVTVQKFRQLNYVPIAVFLCEQSERGMKMT